MLIHKSYKLELDPNDRTITLLKKHCGARRFVWNFALAKRIKMFNENEGKDKFSNYVADAHDIVERKRSGELAWMYEILASSSTQCLMDLDKAFMSFWRRRKDGVGFPKFKKKGQNESFRIVAPNVKLQSRYIKLPVIGIVRTKSKKLDSLVKGKISSITVSCKANRWFASVITEQEIEDKKITNCEHIGIDLGIKTFVTLSDGTKIESCKALKKNEDKLKREQRKLSKKKKGSNNRRRQKVKLQRTYFKVSNIRSDFINKNTTKLAKTKQTIVIEDLDVTGMKFQKDVRDAAFGMFRAQLVYKCKWYGSELIIADRFFPSSKICSRCGYVNKSLKLSQREWVCEACGANHDRDLNAAINLKNVPMGYRKQDVKQSHTLSRRRKSVEKPTTAERAKHKLVRSTSCASLKQKVNIYNKQL